MAPPPPATWRSRNRSWAAVPLGIDLYRRPDNAAHQMALKLARAQLPIPLSDILPPLEAMGLRAMTETPYRLALPDGAVWLHDFSLETADGRPVDVDAERAGFAEVLGAVWTGDVESDGFNRLVVGAEIEPRDVVVLRALAKFLRQAGFPFSQDYVERALATHITIAADLAALFRARLDPALGAPDAPQRLERIEASRAAIAAALELVASLDEDRILRRYLNAIECTLRTNFWQPGADGRPKPYVSFKLDSRRARRAAAAAADGRDLRLQPAGRGRASARRPGGARRHPLVRPARGFPHRDPEPDEGADGQERRHRAGRLQGRLLSSSGRRPAAPATRSRPKASSATRR